MSFVFKLFCVAFNNFKLSDEVFLVDKKKFSYLNDLKLEITVGIAEDMIQSQLYFILQDFAIHILDC